MEGDVNKPQKTFKCKICEKSFGLSYYLERHKKTHTRENWMKCEVCDRMLSSKHHLEQHNIDFQRPCNESLRPSNWTTWSRWTSMSSTVLPQLISGRIQHKNCSTHSGFGNLKDHHFLQNRFTPSQNVLETTFVAGYGGVLRFHLQDFGRKLVDIIGLRIWDSLWARPISFMNKHGDCNRLKRYGMNNR